MSVLYFLTVTGAVLLADTLISWKVRRRVKDESELARAVDPPYRYVSRRLMWMVANVPLGPLAPYVLGLALGRWPRRVK